MVWQLVAAVAIIAQAVFATASFADVHGIGAPSHVEAAGINQHYAHNEATCVACTMAALSVVASPPFALTPAPATLPQAVRAARYSAPAEQGAATTTDSRAPPIRR